VLIISRKPAERVILTLKDVRITIEILERNSRNRDNAVRLGITAPPEVKVLREELESPGRHEEEG
jgi:sRNA-binding carbon storage regulator CsrA